MKFFFVSLVLFSAFFVFEINGQNVLQPGACVQGTIENGTVLGDLVNVACDFSQGKACLTKIEIQEGLFKSTRECTQLLACENNASGNDPKCFPGENGVRICFFCCTFNLCNDDVEGLISGENGEEPTP